MKQCTPRRSGIVLAGALAAIVLSAVPAARAVTTIIWVGTNGDNIWGEGANWSGVMPPTATNIVEFGLPNGSTASPAPATIEIKNGDGDADARALLFGIDPTTVGFTLTSDSGVSLRMAAQSVIAYSGAASNPTEAFTTINAPIVLEGFNSATFGTTGQLAANAIADLTIGAGVKLDGAGNATGTTSGTNGFVVTGDISSGATTGTSLLNLSSGSGMNILSGNVSDGASGAKMSLYVSGAWTLSGDNSGMTGGVTLSRFGIVNINSATALGTGALTITGGPTLDNTSGHAVTVTGISSINTFGGFNFNGSNDLNLGAGSILLNSNATLYTPGTHTLTFGGDISQVGSTNLGITKGGVGTVVLAGKLLYTGPTAIGYTGGALGANLPAGTLIVSGDNRDYVGGFNVLFGTLGIGSATALGTGTLNLSQVDNVGAPGGKSIDNTSGGAMTLSTNNAQSWGGTLNFIGSNDLNMGTGAVTLASVTTLNAGASTLTIGGVIGGGSGLIKNGAGTLVLGGVNTYTGATMVTAGTLVINAGGSMASIITLNAGNLVFNGSTTQGVTIKPTSATTSILSGTGSFAAVTVGGGATGSLAILAAGSANAIGTMHFTGLTLNGGSELQFDLNSDGTPSIDTLSINGRLTFGTTGILDLIGTDLGNTTLGLNTVLTLITYTQKSGNGFTNYADGSNITIGDNVFRINYGTTAMTLTDIAAVPEPSTWALLGFGALGLFAVIRRRESA